MLLATLALLLQDVLNRHCSNKPAAVAPKKPSPICFSSFLELGQKKTVDAAILAARNVVKTETQQTFVNGLLGFITLKLSLEARVYCSQ